MREGRWGGREDLPRIGVGAIEHRLSEHLRHDGQLAAQHVWPRGRGGLLAALGRRARLRCDVVPLGEVRDRVPSSGRGESVHLARDVVRLEGEHRLKARALELEQLDGLFIQANAADGLLLGAQ